MLDRLFAPFEGSRDPLALAIVRVAFFTGLLVHFAPSLLWLDIGYGHGAIAVLEASIASHARDDRHYAPDHLNLAFMLAQRHAIDRALAHLDAARRADPAYVQATLPRMLQAPGLDPAFAEAVRTR
jgi:hypothetical protein